MLKCTGTRIMLFQLKKTTGNNQFDPLFKIILDVIHRSNHCLQRVLFEVDFLHNKRSWSDAHFKSFFVRQCGYCYTGNSFEFSHRLTDFLNYASFCLSCLSLNLKPVNYFTTKRSSMAKRESGSIRPNSLFA
jgi:hypothetical protein